MALLLRPFVASPPEDRQLEALLTYLNLLLRWNARLNLTAIRSPEEIVTRHLGESLFTAERLFPSREASGSVIDVGSGAGFPGLPLKLYAPHLRLTLIESRQKKATFLKEAVRMLHLSDVQVFAGRAETFPERVDLVTLRAVECFERILPVAAALLNPAGAAGDSPARLALLIGAPQAGRARELLPELQWEAPVAIPNSSARVLLVGARR